MPSQVLSQVVGDDGGILGCGVNGTGDGGAGGGVGDDGGCGGGDTGAGGWGGAVPMYKSTVVSEPPPTVLGRVVTR